MADTVLSLQGDVIDLVVWRHYGATVKRVELVLEHPNNYGLADLPETLPIGTPVYMPDFVEPVLIDTIKLWD